MRFGFVTLVTFALILMMTGPVVAADCDDQPDFETALERADSVFVARIISVSDGGTAAVAAVEAIWKGPDLEATVNLDGGDSTDKVSGRTRIHVVGQRYLVVAAWSRHAFTDDLCTATRLQNGSALEIPVPLQDAVGGDEARLPLAAPPAEVSGGAPAPRTAVLAALALVLVLALVFLWRRATAFKPELGERDFAPRQSPVSKELPRPRKRRVAGWLSGRFSRSGRDQVSRLKSERRSNRSAETSPEE